MLSFRQGSYALHQREAADGYYPVADQIVSLTRRQTTRVTIDSQWHPKVTVDLVDIGNAPMAGARYDIFLAETNGEAGTRVRSRVCDNADGVGDGHTSFRLPPTRYLVRQLTPPTTNEALRVNRAADFLVTIVEGQDTEVTVTARRTGNLEITTKDRSGTTLTGACYEAWTKKPTGGREILVTRACDRQAGQFGSTLDGVVLLEVIPAGDYIVVESFSPAGYRPGSDFEITIPGGAATRINVTNDRT